ncbi:monooxygenase [Streptomyces zagrosensis]|uniref:2-polyprenyl-6-methoxyphenol hydroxylase-like FAD-dependent oxidoreductase n=1 Tax=Streptomyces zagrosensis TaxID=1042984 RepID=A0A7W9V0U0_9ACTN|nr:monooxygenase [Streptomyces zagrosensis]MBB5938490.1 2-polyprenyl-6-methoxyphenol hydroxylase-like FAD-dependent oxidoreductase [Streptomyces zagrosensis]
MGTDILVVGAGPTGLMLACELALAGVHTRIVERRTERQRDSRALTLHPRSMELMDMRGLAPRFRSLGRPVPGWHFATLPTRLDFAALDTRHGYTLFLAQARTEALLEQRAQELGVEISRGYETTGLRQDAEGVEVSVRGPAGAETLRARYVVGCDGGRSTVRQAAGIAFPGTDETLTGILGDFATIDAPPAALETARARGVLAVPLEGGLTRFVCIDPDRMRVPASEPVTLEEFRSSLKRICGSDCGVADPRWLSRFGNSTRLADTYRTGRVLLAGDAAHIHFPAAGQGLNTGLQDAMNLGWKLAGVIHGWAPAGLLDSYDAERRPVGQAVTENTEVQSLLVELVLVPQYQRPAAALRTLLDQLLALENVNRMLAGRISALSTAYSSASPEADPLVGRRMPDIGLTAIASNAERVYDLLTQGRFVLLDLTGKAPRRPAPGLDQNARYTAHALVRHDPHAELDGVTELLVRPDGHVAWATRATDAGTRAAQRAAALTAWTGAASAADV